MRNKNFVIDLSRIDTDLENDFIPTYDNIMLLANNNIFSNRPNGLYDKILKLRGDKTVEVLETSVDNLHKVDIENLYETVTESLVTGDIDTLVAGEVATPVIETTLIETTPETVTEIIKEEPIVEKASVEEIPAKKAEVESKSKVLKNKKKVNNKEPKKEVKYDSVARSEISSSRNAKLFRAKSNYINRASSSKIKKHKVADIPEEHKEHVEFVQGQWNTCIHPKAKAARAKNGYGREIKTRRGPPKTPTKLPSSNELNDMIKAFLDKGNKVKVFDQVSVQTKELLNIKKVS